MRRRHASGVFVALAAAVAFLIAGVGSGPASPSAALSGDPVVLAAGDIARCTSSGDEQTAAILDTEPGTVVALGDLAYESGTEQEFADCYGPSWGRHRDRTFPTPGNHDYGTPNAAPYFSYFGANAGPAGLGYYSYDVGAWHLISLNSNCDLVAGGCGAASPMATWLRADLATSSAVCTLAYWHHPSFSSGLSHGPSDRMRPLLDDLYAANVDVLLSASEHHYERFAPQTPANEANPNGIRAFVVGTGGVLGSYPFSNPPAPNSEVRAEGIRGVLKLTLHADSYDWRFVPVAGETYADAGSSACNGPPTPDSTAPSTPASLTAVAASGTRIDLSWSASTDDIGVAGYRIYRDGVHVGSAGGTSWGDSGLTPGQSYSYEVAAYDAALNLSARSASVSTATIPLERTVVFETSADATIEASTPTANLGADPKLMTDASPQRSFLLRFDVNGVGAANVTAAKLRLHVADSSNRGGDFRLVPAGWQETTVTWSSAPAGTTSVGSLGGVSRGNWYELALPAGAVVGDGPVAFRVDSTSSDGADYDSRNGPAGVAPQLVLTVTQPTAPDTVPPIAPSALTATAPAPRRVDLTWTASTDDRALGGYRVFRNGTQVASTSATAWTDTSVSPGTQYAYEVVAFDSAQNVSPMSNTATVTTPPDDVPPTAPMSVTATAVSATWVDIAWSASSDDIGVSGYRVYRDGVEVATTTTTSWADRTVGPGTSYTYEVVAFDAAQNPSPRSTAASVTTLPTGFDEVLPLRAAFYYPWFPEAWTQSSLFPYTHYAPSRGFYDSAAPNVLAGHLADLEYGHFDAAIASWWGRGTRTDGRLDDILAATRNAGSSLKWTVYAEAEGIGNPTVETLRDELAYVRDRYASHPNYLRIAGRFVVFVYNVGDDCDVTARWSAANTVGAYVVMKVFSGHESCAAQPDAWHQYEPGHSTSRQGNDSFSISPGFHNMSEPAPRLARDLDRWRANVRELVGSGTAWQLVTTFNEWGEGSAVESAQEWASGSGHGTFLDVLHEDGAEPSPPPDEQTLVFEPTDDAFVNADAPSQNNGAASTLQVDGSPQKSTLVRFDVSGVAPNVVRSAKLRLRASNSADNGGTIHPAAGAWSEADVTWANAPAAGAQVGALDRAFAGTWYDVPLAAGTVAGDGVVSLRIDSTSADGVDYVSKEGGFAPKLVLAVGPGADTEPPTTPGDVIATAPSAGRVELAWSASTDDRGVTGYRVLRDGSVIGTTTTTSYTDISVGSATSYAYQVVAFDAGGNSSAPSGSAAVTSRDSAAPSVPAGLTGNGTVPGRVELTWVASADDVAVAGYRVFRDGVEVATATLTSYVDTSVSTGSQYSYAVSAFDAAGNTSAASPTVTVVAGDDQPPTAPANLAATTPTEGRVQLTWSPSADNVAVTGYRVIRDGTPIGTTTSTTYTDETVAPGTRYVYEVSAYDSAGNNSLVSGSAAVTTAPVVRTYTFASSADATIVSGSSSNFGAAKTVEVDASPRMAFLLRFGVTGIGTGTVTDAKLRLHVTNSSSRGGDFNLTGDTWSETSVNWTTAPAVGARVGSFAAVSSGTWRELPLSAGAIIGDGNVNFRVETTSSDSAAYDSREAGLTLSPQLIVTVIYQAPDTQPPTAPSGLTASAVSSSRVDLAWVGATDDRAVTTYVIRRNGVEIATSAGTTHADATAAPGTDYTYQVSARDAAGNVSPPSNAASATTPPPDRTLTFTPAADATIVSGTTANGGAAMTLEADANPRKAFLLRFAVSGVGAGTVTAAKVRLHVNNGSNRGGDFTVVANSWLENTVVWSSAPTPGTPAAALTNVSSGTWKEASLSTGAIGGDGSISFRIDSTSNDGVGYDSKEAGPTLAPQLILTVSGWPALTWAALR